MAGRAQPFQDLQGDRCSWSTRQCPIRLEAGQHAGLLAQEALEDRVGWAMGGAVAVPGEGGAAAMMHPGPGDHASGVQEELQA